MSNSPACRLAWAAARVRSAAASWVAGQGDGSLEERGRCRQPAPRLRPDGRAAPGLCGDTPRPDPAVGVREVPRPAVRIEQRIALLGERPVDGCAGRRERPPGTRPSGPAGGGTEAGPRRRAGPSRSPAQSPRAGSRAVRRHARTEPDRRRAPPPRAAATAGCVPATGRRRSNGTSPRSGVRPDVSSAQAEAARERGRTSTNAAARATPVGLPRASATIRLEHRFVGLADDGRVEKGAGVSVGQRADPQTRGRPTMSVAPPGSLTAKTSNDGLCRQASRNELQDSEPRLDPAIGRRRRDTRAGCVSATSDSRLSTASPTRNRSGGSPEPRPNATPSASRCGAGRRSSRSRIRRAELMQAGERQAPSPTRRPPLAQLGTLTARRRDVLQQGRLADARPRHGSRARRSCRRAPPRDADQAPGAR